jgi:hypothetical protein
MFVNGINQNSLYLTELLLNIGYDVYLVIDDSKLNDVTKQTLSQVLYDGRFKWICFTDVLPTELDVLIQLSFSFWHDVKVVKTMKYTNTKLVGYCCGNSYIINSEKILYNQHKSRDNSKECFKFIFEDKTSILDEIWSIPQMVNTNQHYWKTLYRCDCIGVPFIWSNRSIDLVVKYFGLDNIDKLMYVNRGQKKKIGIFEPNISIMKWALPCLLVCENTYRQNKNIDHVYITNINLDLAKNAIDASDVSVHSKINDFNIQSFNHILVSLDIFTDKLCSIESRYNTLQFMSNHCDIAVSHQWENPLNYLYFDLAWMGWAIVHNAYLCKDVGYYYEGFDYENGGNVLSDVINNHDANAEAYLQRNRMAIDRFLPTNLELQEKYKKLIMDVMKK